MNQFVVGIAWSQTDHENVLVHAHNVAEAEEKVKKALPNIHHIVSVRLIHHMIIGQ